MSHNNLLAARRVSRFVFLVLLLTLAYVGAARADSFSNGQFVTYVQSGWSSVPNAVSILNADFATVYFPDVGVVTVGLPNTGFTMQFVSPSTILLYLPAV
jgi:hypothetical protein